MALAHARYGFLLRSIPVGMAGKFSATITADAFVVFAAALYLGLETKVSWPGAAFFLPATPVISVVGEALSRRASRALAMSASFMAMSGNCSGWLACGAASSYFVARAELRSAWTDECVRPYTCYCSNNVTCLVSGWPPLRRRFAAPI